MSKPDGHDRQSGVAGLLLLAVIVLGLAGAAFMFVARAQKAKGILPAAAQQVIDRTD